MHLKLHATKQKITVVMSLIIMQACLTCVWLAFNGHSGTDDLEQTYSDQSSLRKKHLAPSIFQPPRTHGAKFSHQSHQESPWQPDKMPRVTQGDPRVGKTVFRENATTAQSNKIPTRPVSRVQMPQSKWLLHLLSTATSYCNGKVELYENMTALMRDAIVDPSKGHARARGGESIRSVLLQQETTEYYQLENGLLNIDNCTNLPDHGKFSFGSSSLPKEAGRLSNAVKLSSALYRTKAGETVQDYDGDFVIILTRYEYANVYWTVIDLYNTFLMMQLYNRTFQDTDLWILDAHPDTSLEGIFTGTFRRVFRLTELQKKTRFRNLLPCFSRVKSPLLMKVLRPLTLVSKFRSSVLSALQVPVGSSEDRARRCQDGRLTVLFIWRRNYVGHPRNPKGIVSRKISNEDQLLNGSKQHFANYSIRAVQLDKLPMSEQLDLIGNADIMVGMHGAAFGFTVFMQEGAGVLEMWPKWHHGNWHMEYLAKRSGLYYKVWQNTDDANENLKDKSTTISVKAVNRKLEELSVNVCSKYKGETVL